MFAPELLPQLNEPVEVQDLRKIDDADKKDIEDWVEIGVEVLPQIQKDALEDSDIIIHPPIDSTIPKLDHDITQIKQEGLSLLFNSQTGIEIQAEIPSGSSQSAEILTPKDDKLKEPLSEPPKDLPVLN